MGNSWKQAHTQQQESFDEVVKLEANREAKFPFCSRYFGYCLVTAKADLRKLLGKNTGVWLAFSSRTGQAAVTQLTSSNEIGLQSWARVTSQLAPCAVGKEERVENSRLSCSSSSASREGRSEYKTSDGRFWRWDEGRTALHVAPLTALAPSPDALIPRGSTRRARPRDLWGMRLGEPGAKAIVEVWWSRVVACLGRNVTGVLLFFKPWKDVRGQSSSGAGQWSGFRSGRRHGMGNLWEQYQTIGEGILGSAL